MPTFYFNIRGIDTYVPDPQGHDYANLDEARQDAIEKARALLSPLKRQNNSADRRQLQITDTNGRLCAIVPFREAMLSMKH